MKVKETNMQGYKAHISRKGIGLYLLHLIPENETFEVNDQTLETYMRNGIVIEEPDLEELKSVK